MAARGFTLIELLITLSIMLVLVMAVIPGFRVLMLDQRRTALVNEFVAALNQARTEAVVRRVTVSACPSGGATADFPICNTNASDWSQGLLVFVDRNGDGRVTDVNGDGLIAQDEDWVLAQRGRLAPGVAIIGGDPLHRHFSFRSNGIPHPDTTGNLYFCDKRGAADGHGRILSVDFSGRLSSFPTTTSCGA